MFERESRETKDQTVLKARRSESVPVHEASEPYGPATDEADRLRVTIHEIKTPELDATLVAENVASQLEKRIAFRRALKQTMLRSMRAGAKGAKIQVSGRLGGSEMSRREFGALIAVVSKQDINRPCYEPWQPNSYAIDRSAGPLPICYDPPRTVGGFSPPVTSITR